MNPDVVDRAAAVRRATIELIADRGLHATSVAAVAGRAGVAAGTIYVHYPSKDELVAAAFAEVKVGLADAVVQRIIVDDPPERRFRSMWLALYEALASDPEAARFLVQMESTPAYAAHLHNPDPDGPGGALVAAAVAPDLAACYAELPLAVLYDLGFGPALRAAANPPPTGLDDAALDRLAAACWRAVTTGVLES